MTRRAAAIAAVLAIAPAACSAGAGLQDYRHIVVIYEENHSFDNLYGMWGAVGSGAVDGVPDADEAHTRQVGPNGTAYDCLLQVDVNLASPPLPGSCTDPAGFSSAFENRPFNIDDYIGPDDTTCPPRGRSPTNGVAKGTGRPGGCTRDLVHRYYVNRYQIDGGRMDRFAAGSDAAGLVMGHYDTTKLPIYRYLHRADAPHYVIADMFFQGAFGGSFLNHQWLIAAATPVFADAPNDGSADDQHTVVDPNGMPMTTPLYKSPPGSGARPGALTASCDPPPGRPATPAGAACGDYAVNTMQPFAQPYRPGTDQALRLPPLDNATIGDRLTAAGVDWAWYSGGWSNADGDIGAPGWTNGNGPDCADPDAREDAVFPNCPDKSFQFHHQPFNYFRNYAPGTTARAAHLRDEAEFIEAARDGKLKAVSFVKPIGEENEHPGYASVATGNSHLVKLIETVLNGPEGADTLIIVAYDEFGGQWDHVPPPGMAGGPDSPHDIWGPGPRIPVLLISKRFRESGVDHKPHDTTSILKTIEDRFHLKPLGTRDAKVRGLESALEAGE